MNTHRNFSLPSLLFTQTQVVFNEHASKIILISLVQLVNPQASSPIASLVSWFVVLPFILFAPIVGWIADRFSKRAVMSRALILQLAVMIGLSVALWIHSLNLVLVCFALIATQMSIFSPAKQGVLKEIVGKEKLGMAVGWMEMLSIIAILLGSLAGGISFDFFTKRTSDPWQGAFYVTLGLTLTSIAAITLFKGVQLTQPQSHEPFRFKLLVSHFTQVRELWTKTHLRLAALGIVYFYSFAGVINMSLIQFGRDLNNGKVGSATDTGILLAIIGGGIAIGSMISAFACRRNIELGLIPIGALGLTIGLLFAGLSQAQSINFYIGLLALGFFGAMFIVPLNAWLQDKAADEERGRTLAATNLLLHLGTSAAISLQFFFSQYLNLSAPDQFLIMLAPSILVALYVLWLLPESLLRFSILMVTRCIYRMRVTGRENIPSGGALLVSNHVSYVDALILQAACPRKIRFIAYEEFHKRWWLGWFLRMFEVIPISSKHAKDAIRTAAEAMKEGHLVCVFPEGELTRTGHLLALKKGFEIMARQAKAPVLPAYIDHLWGSIFSFERNRYFWKTPKEWPYPVKVMFGNKISSENLSGAEVRKALLDQNEEAFQRRPELKGNLGYACLKSLCKQPWKEQLIDTFPKRRSFSRGMLLALSLALACRWRNQIPSQRVGIVLPPGIGGTVANLAIALLGKIPVNLNFTAGRSAIESCLRRAEIDTVISAEALKKKIADFPWPTHTLDISKEIEACGKISILRWLAIIWIFPSAIIAKMIHLSSHGDQAEAGLLFTSGSSGDPKGVVLSHRNIVGNVQQINSINIIESNDVLLSCLPLFHSFGFTITLWYPLMEGVKTITVPSPLEIKKIAETIHAEAATLFFGTPTFIRPYLTKATSEQMKTLRGIVVGAEKLPTALLEAFTQKFNIPLLEGYGLTETSPVTSVNLPNPKIMTKTASLQLGTRPGSVGRLLPGMTARIVDPETGKERALTEVGMLHLRGPNIFTGYLNDQEKTDQVLKSKWFITGDLARFDEDGFLFIEGRLSRFSKIGGEMVPHGTVEQKIIEILNLSTQESQPIAITGIPDETKGEALVLLTTCEIDTDIRKKLLDAGLPNLWIPKIIKKVEKIPTLASGKLDLKGCENLAKNVEEKAASKS